MANGGTSVGWHEFAIEALQQGDACIDAIAVDASGDGKVLDLKCFVGNEDAGLNASEVRVADDERGVLRSKEAGGVGGGVEESCRADAHKAGEGGILVTEFAGNKCAD